MFKRIARWLHDFQELTGWLPALLVLTLAAFFLLPAIDPRSGIDGLADLFHALVNTVKLTMAAFGAWLLQRLYFRDLSADEETSLQDRELAGDPHARAVLWRNRLEWLACFAFCFSALFLL